MAASIGEMTLQEVAGRAKVSTATVSRVLNDTGRVKEAARARVLKAVGEPDYHPNLHARTLAGGCSRTLGLIVSNLRNPFFLDIFQALEIDAHEKGFEVVVANTDYRPEHLVTHARLMRGRRVAGLAVVVSEMDPALVEGLVDTRIPVVFYDVGVAAHHCAKIRTDYARGTRRVIEFLPSRSAIGTWPSSVTTPRSRPCTSVESAFAEAVRDCCGDAARTAVVAEEDSPRRAGLRATRQLFASGFRPHRDRLRQRLHGPRREPGAPRDGAHRSPGRLGGRLRQHQPVRVRVPGAQHQSHRAPGEDRAPGERGLDDARRRGRRPCGGGRP